jgi:hypothetical protein
MTQAPRDGRNPDRVDRMGEQEPSVVAEATMLGWLILSRWDRTRELAEVAITTDRSVARREVGFLGGIIELHEVEFRGIPILDRRRGRSSS